MIFKTLFFSLVVLNLAVHGQGQGVRAVAESRGMAFARSAVVITADGTSARVNVTARSDSVERSESVIQTLDDEEDSVTVTTSLRGETDDSRNSFLNKPSRRMSPGGKGIKKKKERKANKVCLVTDLSEFDAYVKRGRNVVGVRRFNDHLIEIVQSMQSKTRSSRVTLRTTQIPEDIQELCNITEEDLRVASDDVDLVPSVLRFTFSSRDGVPKDKKTLMRACSQVFEKSINGLAETCVEAVEKS